jgi:endonuclease-3
MNKESVISFFTALAAERTQPKTELLYTTPYTLLVAVILSAQATDVGVNKATPALFKHADTPAKMLALGLEKLKERVKTIGLYNGKAKNIIAMSEILLRDHGGEVPRDREALEKLPGVGRKTANVVLNEAFGEHTIAVDTHVFRVANRTGLARGATVRVVEDKLMKVVPPQFAQHAHHWLILLGRYICKARKPLCPLCPVRQWCEYKDKTVEI